MAAERIQLAKEPDFALGPVQVRPSAREVLIGARKELLEPRMMQVLTALARADGAVVSREQLVESCWDGRIVGEDSIQRCMVRLRKLAEGSDGAFAIETVPKIGYRLTVAASPHAAAPEPVAENPVKRRRPWLWSGMLAAVLVVAAAATWFFWPEPEDGWLRTAVLPFQSVGDAQARKVAAGLPDAITAALTQVQALTVSPQAAASASHGGARLLVTGKVEEAGGKLRVQMRIEDATTNLALWSATVERDTADSTALLDQVAARIAHDIHRARRDLGTRGNRTPAGVLSAYIHMLDLIPLGTAHAAELIPAERDLVLRAPDWSRAHSGLACDLAGSVRGQDSPLADRIRAEARQEAERALSLDPDNPEVYIAFQLIEAPNAFARREALVQQGLAKAPQEAWLYTWEGVILRNVGRNRAAAPVHRQALMLDPTNPRPTVDAVMVLLIEGRIAEAEAMLQRALQRWPDNPVLRQTLLDELLLYAAPEKALDMLTAFRTGEPGLDPAAEAAWRRVLSDRASGRRDPAVSKALIAAADAGLTGRTNTVVALAQRGEVDEAFALANRVLDREPYRLSAPQLFEPPAANLQRDPRFIPLLARMKVVNYWRTTGHWADFCGDPGLPYSCRAEVARLK